MSVIVSVQAVTRAAEVHRFPMEDGDPADGGEWELIETLQPGQEADYFAHARKAIMVREVAPTEI